MLSTAAVVIGTILLGAATLWLVARVWCLVDQRRRRQEEAARQSSGYVTMCQHGPDGTRWIVRRPVSELPDSSVDYEIPEFLRK